ncbi:MAG TPA: DUF4082 domain-containing protein, partial [Lacipirellulaceae bacterium]|nr:DUF4082 domain-containing protein [Lacipirellulaceae bacterium]
MFFSPRRPKKNGRGKRSAARHHNKKIPSFEALEERMMLSASQIVAENQLPGTQGWEVDGGVSSTIQGYAAEFSVDHGQKVEFKIDTTASDYHIDIYRLGWYQGIGARLVATVNPTNLNDQPSPIYHADTNSTDASNWHVSASWNVPVNAVSGVYYAKLVRDDGRGENFILFVVRDDEGHSDLLVQTSDATWEAYNTWGGSSLYAPNYPGGRARAVTYSRPFNTAVDTPLNFYFGEEYAMTRFLERNGFDVSYTSSIDTAVRGSELLEHKVFLSVGHDEYWSGEQRANVEAARDAGVNLAFFSGNEVFWKTRWGADSSGTPYTTLFVYKETLDNAITDPTPGVWTGTWRDPRFAATTDGGHPENALTGTIFTVNSNGDLGSTIDVSSNFSALRFWRDTVVASLDPGESVSLGDRALGYEWDEDLDNGFRPAGLIDLSSTTRNVAQYLQDYGSTYGKGTATHSMTLYRASSGALVFSAGSIQYSWALDDYHPVYQAATDAALQQATINLFADMGVQPATLMAELVRATASTDTIAPVSTILSPVAGALLPANQTVTATGTAMDSGGGVIADVEVSVDGGTTWHRATGSTNWTYTFTTRSNGPFSILSRAVDDSGNIEQNGPKVDVNPIVDSGIYSFWRDQDQPTTIDSRDKNSIEVGVRFTSDTNGYITGLRFYKASTNTGTHIGNLWSSTGQLLATATFTNETASGWQQVNFATPVPITAGVTYIASYFAPFGHYSANNNYFDTQGISYGPLHANPTGVGGTNGVYRYGSNSGFPTLTYANTNYWVDVVLDTTTNSDTTAPTVESFKSTDPSGSLTTDSAIVVTLSEALQSSSVNTNSVMLLKPDPNSVPGGCCSTPGGWCSGCPLQMGANTVVISTTVSYNATNQTITVTPTDQLSTSSIYTVVLIGGDGGVKDMAGNSLATDTAASFLTPGQPASIRSSIWPNDATPTTTDSGSSQAAELGVKFTADQSGFITGLRFYKSAGNTGTHVAHLWSSTGQLLATATFANETASGWQQVNFATPVAITAGQTYIASYHTDSGHYAMDSNYFSSSIDSGMLHVPAAGGVYALGATAFPTLTSQASNYWVDVELSTPPPLDTAPPTVLSLSQGAGAQNVDVNSDITVKFSEAMDPSSITAGTVKLIDSMNGFVPTVLMYNPITMTATLTPTAPLAYSMTYTIVVTGGAMGVKDQSGNALSDTVTSSFVTSAAPAPDLIPPEVTGISPADGTPNVSPNGTITIAFSEGLNAATVNINSVLLLKNATNRVAESVSYDAANHTVTITPTSPLENATSYTVYILGGASGVKDLSNNALDGSFISSFSTAAAPVISSMWTTSSAPSTADVGESDSLEVGVKFTSDTDGYITGIRFYKSAKNTGTHIGSLWSSTGQLLATATFTSESSSGWQQVNFATPVAITAGQTYIASYFDPNGHFSVDRGYFSSPMTSGPLHVATGGGVFQYGNSSAFPTQSYQNSNYWVDVVLNNTPPADTTPPTVVSTNPANGATSVATNSSVTVAFSEKMDAATISNSTVKILDGNSIVTSNVVFNSSNNSVTITPVVAFANSKTYTISLVGDYPGVKDLAGNALAQTFTSTFTTVASSPVDTTPPTVSGISPANGTSNVATSASVTVAFSEALDASTVTSSSVKLLSGNTAVSATVSYNASAKTVTIAPTAALSNSTTYTVSVQGVKDLAGNALAQTFTSNFTTAAAPATVSSLWPTNTQPSIVDVKEGDSLEVGVKFTSDTDGYITGIRFYKSAKNTGTHIGSLWSSTGQLLATATFTSESSSGWQQVNFATPVAITAGQT